MIGFILLFFIQCLKWMLSSLVFSLSSFLKMYELFKALNFFTALAISHRFWYGIFYCLICKYFLNFDHHIFFKERVIISIFIFWPYPAAHGILILWRDQTCSGSRVLTTGPPGRSLKRLFRNTFLNSKHVDLKKIFIFLLISSLQIVIRVVNWDQNLNRYDLHVFSPLSFF